MINSDALIYVFHHRFPDARAAAIFAAEEVGSFSQHRPVTMIVPQRSTTNLDQARTQYHFSDRVTLMALPVVELSATFLRRIAFQASVLTFSYQLFRTLRSLPGSWVVTTDHLPALVATFCRKKVLIEIHDFPTRWNPLWRLLLKRATKILSTNTWKAGELTRRFNVASERIFVERNAIDLTRFRTLDVASARRALHLSLHGPIVLYTGNLYRWKGVETLLTAARALPDVQVYIVGGAASDRERLERCAPPNITFVPPVPHQQIPLWQAAADVLILPNTGREPISVYYTSPLKLFEYMASERPIVASDLIALREILPEKAGFFFAPDDPVALAAQIRAVLTHPAESAARAQEARRAVAPYTWIRRAERILAHLTV